MMNSQCRINTIQLNSIIVILLITLVIAFPIYFILSPNTIENDHYAHIGQAIDYMESGEFDIAYKSHPALELLIVSMVRLNIDVFNPLRSHIIIMVASQLIIVLITYFWIGNSNLKQWELWRSIVSITFPLLAPIMLLAVKDGQYYLGYTGIAVYHNPTIQLLKPVALACVLFALRGLKSDKQKWWVYIVSAALIIFSGLIKPNFIIAFLPALGILSAYKLIQHEKFDFKLMLFGFALPGLVVLIWQWLLMYETNVYGFHIIFAPFGVVNEHSKFVVAKFLLSTLFVIQALIVFRKNLISDQTLFLGLLTFMIGMIMNYFFAESGAQFGAGNFLWTGQIGNFVLLFILIGHSFKAFMGGGNYQLWQKLLASGTYLAHLIGGVVYYIFCITSLRYQ